MAIQKDHITRHEFYDLTMNLGQRLDKVEWTLKDIKSSCNTCTQEINVRRTRSHDFILIGVGLLAILLTLITVLLVRIDNRISLNEKAVITTANSLIKMNSKVELLEERTNHIKSDLEHHLYSPPKKKEGEGK